MKGYRKLANMSLTKDEQKMFPKVFTVRTFKNRTDIRDGFNSLYATERTVNNPREENSFYEGLNHEENLTIECKLPNGVIK